MTLTFGTAYKLKPGTVDIKELVEAVHIETAEDLIDLRENHEDWHEGALSILRYPTATPRGFFSHEPPKMFGSIQVLPGATVTKDPAGNFGFIDKEELITS